MEHQGVILAKYSFCCTKCSHIYERNSKVSEHSNEDVCEKCGELARQVFTPPNIVYKGDGFYTTDKNK